MYYKHLSIRVAWHDNRWNAKVCKNPKENTCCSMLPRIYSGKNEEIEMTYSNLDFDKVPPKTLPCLAESAGFMNENEWQRLFEHPYSKSSDIHKCLLPTKVTIPSYSTFAVPFWWMLKSNQTNIDKMYPDHIAPDEQTPFPTSWVFGKQRQLDLLDLFFRNIKEKQSLVFFYTKNGNAVDENTSRLIIGVGLINNLSRIQMYESKTKDSYPFWDRLVQHSIRPIEDEKYTNGVLLPYQEYLELSKNDSSINQLLDEIKIAIDEDSYIKYFSYGSEIVNHDAALYVLQKLFTALSAVRRHGLIKGNWEGRLKWINDRIADVWKSRGAFPGFPSILQAIGLRYGTALAYDLYTTGMIKPEDNPWDMLERLINNRSIKLPKVLYEDDFNDGLRKVWPILRLKTEKINYLKLLSRFEITPTQAERWVRPNNRGNQKIAINDSEILNNPYIISELDETDGEEPAISVKTIDAGLMSDDTIIIKHPIPAPSKIGSFNDARRVRAIILNVLKKVAYTNGDTLLSIDDTIEKVNTFSVSMPCKIIPEWIDANRDFLSKRVNIINLAAGRALQLHIYTTIEEKLDKIVRARSSKQIDILSVDWESLLITTIEDNTKVKFDKNNKRFSDALNDQVNALNRITAYKMNILIGPAGTGKTSVMGALLRCKEIRDNGVLLLAPTGKARVKLGRMANTEAFTVAQFLNRQKRFDWKRMKPLFEGGDKYRAEKTVVIDECSMLTIEDLYAVFEALDLSHVTRVILVGDPYQLPPIGAGRPFADICKYLDSEVMPEKADDIRKTTFNALAKLKVIVRQTSLRQESDTLKLANWFSGETVEPNSDEIFGKMADLPSLNDLSVHLWKTSDELDEILLCSLKDELNMKSKEDIDGFNFALGFERDENHRWIYPFSNPNGAENFQIISPVNNPPWGNFRINRMIQENFRGERLKRARRKQDLKLGDQDIVVHDKIIQNTNQAREGWNGFTEEDITIANGEIGIVCNQKSIYLNVAFCGRNNLSFGYSKNDFRDGEGPLNLAYSISVHKSQGSDFKKVFLILPKTNSIISRELIYTALTRSREKLILLIEGDSPAWLFNLSNGMFSETAKRNSNLFFQSLRVTGNNVPFAEHLIHSTEKENLYVRSKSEVIIVNMLVRENVDFIYEREFIGENIRGIRRPDFSFVDAAGDLIIWEHLGMLNRDSYRQSWEEKKKFYEANGFKEGVNLFTTADDDRGTLDIPKVTETIRKIKELI